MQLIVRRDRKNILRTEYPATAMAAERLWTIRVRRASVSSVRLHSANDNQLDGTLAQFSQFARLSWNHFRMGWQTNVWRAMTAKDTRENEG